MTESENIKFLIENKNWQELENTLSSLKEFTEDKDGNPEFLYFFKNNIPEAIVLSEKYNILDQHDILFSLQFSSRDFRNDLVYLLMTSNTIKPKKFFESCNLDKDNFDHLKLISSDIFKTILKYYDDNDIKNTYDQSFIKMIFSKKEIENIINTKQSIFEFILKSSNINDFFLFNKYTSSQNYLFLNIISNYLKKEINNIDYPLFLNETKESVLHLEQRLKHPFTPNPHKEMIRIILEDLNKINLFLNLNNKQFEPNKKNKHKI